MSNENNDIYEKGNTMLFYISAVISFCLMVWLTLAFFRDALDMHDVSAGMVTIGLVIITSYAGHNKFLKNHCSDDKRSKKPGEWIFVAIVIWSGIMWTIYQTRVFWHWKEIELAVPDQFYAFIGVIVIIFGGTKVWDVVLSVRKPNGKNEDKSTEA